MTTTHEHASGPRRLSYLNGVLTVIAVCLALLVIDRLDLGTPSAEAGPTAQPDRGAGLISAADQRKIMIAEIKRLTTKVEGVDKALKEGISVKVTDMPEIKLPEKE